MWQKNVMIINNVLIVQCIISNSQFVALPLSTKETRHWDFSLFIAFSCLVFFLFIYRMYKISPPLLIFLSKSFFFLCLNKRTCNITQYYYPSGNLSSRGAIISGDRGNFSSFQLPIPAALTDVLVINGHKDIDGPLHPQQPQAEGHQQLEEDAAAGPHVRQEQEDLPPEALPGGLVLLGAAQEALRWGRRGLGAVHQGLETFWLTAERNNPTEREATSQLPVCCSPRPARLRWWAACTAGGADPGLWGRGRRAARWRRSATATGRTAPDGVTQRIAWRLSESLCIFRAHKVRNDWHMTRMQYNCCWSHSDESLCSSLSGILSNDSKRNWNYCKYIQNLF